MNELIKEFFLKSGGRFSFDENGSPYQFEQDELEKFAMLIIQECADFIDSKLEMTKYSGEVVSWADGEDIKDHFGVK
jgi:hypothetical protein